MQAVNRQTYKLDCGHKVMMDVVPMLQYPEDVHYVLCPACRDSKQRLVLPWKEIAGVSVPNVSGRTPQVMPTDVMRVQSRKRVPVHRSRPFPYGGFPRRNRG